MDAGLPEGLISVVHGGAKVAHWLIDEPAIRFFAFTGSTEVGRDIQQRAGLRRTQMELGSIAFTVLCADANLDAALPKIVGAAYRKAGQVCTSIQNLLVERSRVEEVADEADRSRPGAALRRPARCEDAGRPGDQRGQRPAHRRLDPERGAARRAPAGRRTAGRRAGAAHAAGRRAARVRRQLPGSVRAGDVASSRSTTSTRPSRG